MIRISVFLITLMFCSCEEHISEEIFYECIDMFKYDIVEANKRIKNRDTLYAYCLIESLKDAKLEDCEFVDRLFSISDDLHFQYCWINCLEDDWLLLPENKRDSTRMIIAKGLELYRSSCLFMSDIKYPGTCYDIDLHDYCNKRLLRDHEYQDEFKKMLERVCKECE